MISDERSKSKGEKVYVWTVAVGKDKLTHLPRMYSLREKAHGGQGGHQGAQATKCMCVSLVLLMTYCLGLWSPGRLRKGIGTPIIQAHRTCTHFLGLPFTF